MTVEDGEGKQRGALTESEEEAGFFQGNVDLDGDGNRETQMSVDTNTQPPTVNYYFTGQELLDQDGLTEGMPTLLFPSYGVELRKGPGSLTWEEGSSVVFDSLFAFNHASSGSPLVEDSYILDPMSLYYRFSFSDMATQIANPVTELLGIDESQLLGRNIYIKASQDLILTLQDNGKDPNDIGDDSLSSIRFEMLRAEGLMDISDGEKSWAQDIYITLPIQISVTLPENWAIRTTMECVLVSESSLVMDGDAIPFSLALPPLSNGDDTICYVSNGLGEPNLQCLVMMDEAAVAKDEVSLWQALNIEDCLSEEDAEAIVQALPTTLEWEWTPPESSSSAGQQPELILTAQTPQFIELRASQEREFGLELWFPGTPGNYKEFAFSAFGTAPLGLQVSWELDGLPDEWEYRLLDSRNNPQGLSQLHSGEHQELTLLVSASAGAVAGESHILTLRAFDSRGRELDSMEFELEIILQESVSEPRNYIRELVPVRADITVEAGGILVYQDSELVFETPGAVLRVKDGGQLIIHDSLLRAGEHGSFSLVVEPGGMLLVERSFIKDVGNGVILDGRAGDQVIICDSFLSSSGNSLIHIKGGTPELSGNRLELTAPSLGVAVQIDPGTHPVVVSSEISYSADIPVEGSTGILISQGHQGELLLSHNTVKGFGTGIIISRDLEYDPGVSEVAYNQITGNRDGIVIQGGYTVELLGNQIRDNKEIGISVKALSVLNAPHIVLLGGLIYNPSGWDLLSDTRLVSTRFECVNVKSSGPEDPDYPGFTTSFDAGLFELTVSHSLSLMVLDSAMAPLEDATVRLSWEDDPDHTQELQTNQQGECLFFLEVLKRSSNEGEQLFNPYHLSVDWETEHYDHELPVELKGPMNMEVTIQTNGVEY